MARSEVWRAASAFFILITAGALFSALSKDIAITQFSELPEVVSTLFSIEAAEAAAGQTLSTEEYQEQIDQVTSLIQQFLFSSDAARLDYEALTKPTGYTVCESAKALIASHDTLPGLLIIIFSVIFPIAKTLATAILAFAQLRNVRLLDAIEKTHKYTMLDVFIVAVTLFAVSNQELLQIDPGPAVSWYIVYIITGFISVSLLRRSIEEQSAPAT